MLIRNNRKAPTGVTFENIRDAIVVQAGAIVALPDGLAPTEGTRALMAYGEVEDLQDGAPRATVRNASLGKPTEQVVRLTVPLAPDVPNPTYGFPREKAIELRPGESLNVRREFIETPWAISLIEGQDLEIVEAA